MVLLDGVNGFAEIYCMPVYPRYRCLSEERTKRVEKMNMLVILTFKLLG